MKYFPIQLQHFQMYVYFYKNCPNGTETITNCEYINYIGYFLFHLFQFRFFFHWYVIFKDCPNGLHKYLGTDDSDNYKPLVNIYFVEISILS